MFSEDDETDYLVKSVRFVLFWGDGLIVPDDAFFLPKFCDVVL